MNKELEESGDLTKFEKLLWIQGFSRILGLDEVGRGCLAGPVVAAGVVLDPEKPIEGLNDSKQLSAVQRERLDPVIRRDALAFAIAESSVEEIDRMNILKASILAMHRCIEQVKPAPDYLLIDGNYFPASLIPHQTIVKGDARSASIAAASILAKVYRDRLMEKLSTSFPEYKWNENFGYPTAWHRSAVKATGRSVWHRNSFKIT